MNRGDDIHVQGFSHREKLERIHTWFVGKTKSVRRCRDAEPGNELRQLCSMHTKLNSLKSE